MGRDQLEGLMALHSVASLHHGSLQVDVHAFQENLLPVPVGKDTAKVDKGGMRCIIRENALFLRAAEAYSVLLEPSVSVSSSIISS